MSEEQYSAIVPVDLRDLVPVFLRNRKQELHALQHAIARMDYEQLAHLGHRMKGVGEPYGFPDVTTIGAQIEQFARAQDLNSLASVIARYRHYLRSVKITYGPRSL